MEDYKQINTLIFNICESFISRDFVNRVLILELPSPDKQNLSSALSFGVYYVTKKEANQQSGECLLGSNMEVSISKL